MHCSISCSSRSWRHALHNYAGKIYETFPSGGGGDVVVVAVAAIFGTFALPGCVCRSSAELPVQAGVQSSKYFTFGSDLVVVAATGVGFGAGGVNLSRSETLLQKEGIWGTRKPIFHQSVEKCDFRMGLSQAEVDC